MIVRISYEDALASPSVSRHLRAVARHVLFSLGLRPVELSILVVGSSRMAELNRRHRAIDRPTDVLAFAMLEEEGSGRVSIQEVLRSATDEERPLVLGDVVLCLDRARQQAAEAGHDLKQESALLLIHGILHLLGHDHPEGGEDPAMEAQAQRCLEACRRARLLRPGGAAC